MTGGFKIDEDEQNQQDLQDKSELSSLLQKSKKNAKDSKDYFTKKKIRALYGHRSSVREIEKAFTKNQLDKVHVHHHDKPCTMTKKKKQK